MAKLSASALLKKRISYSITEFINEAIKITNDPLLKDDKKYSTLGRYQYALDLLVDLAGKEKAIKTSTGTVYQAPKKEGEEHIEESYEVEEEYAVRQEVTYIPVTPTPPVAPRPISTAGVATARLSSAGVQTSALPLPLSSFPIPMGQPVPVPPVNIGIAKNFQNDPLIQAHRKDMEDRIKTQITALKNGAQKKEYVDSYNKDPRSYEARMRKHFEQLGWLEFTHNNPQIAENYRAQHKELDESVKMYVTANAKFKQEGLLDENHPREQDAQWHRMNREIPGDVFYSNVDLDKTITADEYANLAVPVRREFLDIYEKQYATASHPRVAGSPQWEYASATAVVPTIRQESPSTGVTRNLAQEAASRTIKKGLEKTTAGKAVTGATTKLVEKATQAGVGIAARTGVLAALGVGIRAVASALAGPVGTLLSTLAIGVMRFLKKHGKGLAQLGTGLLGLFALTGSTLVGALGASFLGLSLAGGGPTAMVAGIGGIGATLGGFFMALILPAIIAPILISFIVVVATIALILFIINTGGYLTPHADPLAPVNQAQSQYFDVAKLANPPGPLQNSDLPKEITYTVAIKANSDALSNITFLNAYNITQQPLVAQAPSPPIPDNALPAPTPPATIAANAVYTLTYKVTLGAEFKDSVVCDNFTVGADANGTPSSETTSACVTIGTPPTQCPSGWPVGPAPGREYKLTQGFNTFYTGGSHGLNGPEEAIDVGLGNTADPRPPRSDDFVYATHDGAVQKIDASSRFGNRVQITGSCNGQSFVSYYGHLRNASFGAGLSVGQRISKGTIIGLVGNTGVIGIGYHVHYAFYPYGGLVKMGPPYVPVNREQIRGCLDFVDCGSIVIQ